MKKVLIISYYWPPAGGSGVQRWLKFAKYLPKNNWKPIIYTPENPYFELQDKTLLKDISKECIIWKKSIWEPYTLKDKIFGKVKNLQNVGLISDNKSLKNKFLNWVRGNLFIPDPKIYWVKPSINFLKEKIKKENINHIITTGPPHSMHLIGLGLKNIFSDLKWIADFRDPWSSLDLLDEFYLSKYARKKHRDLERKVLENADLTLSVSETWVNDFKSLGAKNVSLITNGYDHDDFNIKKKDQNKFIIGHYGLLNHLRNPRYLWKSLDLLCQENADFESKLEIHLSGNVDKKVISEIKSYSLLKKKVKQLGYISHSQVLKQDNEVDVLLLLLFNSLSGVGNYPGKIFEYFAAQKPILAFGPFKSDTQKLIHKTNSGFYFTYEEKNIKEKILDIFNKKVIFKIKDINSFSRENLTMQLANILNKM